MINFTESILSSNIDDIDVESVAWMTTKKFYNERRSKTPKELDALGKPLQKGDLVIGVYGGQRPMVGVIVDIGNGVCAVCYTGDLKDMDKQKTPIGGYKRTVGCYDLLKINPEIAELIIGIK